MSTIGIPLQLTKLRDTKYAANKKVDVLDEQLEDIGSSRKFDIKKVDDLFDGLPINESCPETQCSKSQRTDIFAEYESEKSRGKQYSTNSNTILTTPTKDNEMNEGKAALKLIPKQLLGRRTNEQVKSKRILEAPLEDPARHAAALLTIQKKLLESHVLKNDNKESLSEDPPDEFKSRYSTASNNESLITDKLLDKIEFDVVSKSSMIETRSRSPISEKLISVRSEQSESSKDDKNNDTKDYKTCTNRNTNDSNVQTSIRSPIREQRKRSPNRRETEKRYPLDYSKDKKEKKYDDAGKSDRRDKSSKTDFIDSRRKMSPLGRGRRKRSRSPCISWERLGSGSPGHSWSRSRSKSPKRKDENIVSTSIRDREKKRDRFDDERSSRSRIDDRRERYARSPTRSNYNEGKITIINDLFSFSKFFNIL